MKNSRQIQDTGKLINVNCFTRKADAFTLMELTVTLLISGLVIMAAFSIINNFTRLSLRMNRDNDQYTGIYQFHKAITNDMQQSQKIIHYDDETIFYIGDRHVSYQWKYDCMVRTVNEQVDSFLVIVNDWHMTRDKVTGLPVVLEIEIENEDNGTDTFRLVKTYDNDVLFNNSELR